VSALIAGLRQDRLLERAEQKADRAQDRGPRPLSQLLPELTPLLLRICEVDTEADLPPVYLRMANAKKADKRTIVRLLLQERCDQVGVATPLPPTVTTELVDLLVSAKFGADDIDDLTQGFTPFAFNHRAYGCAARVEAQAGDHDSMLSGNLAPTLAERRHLKLDSLVFPAHLIQAEAGLGEYSTACDVALGVNHRFSVYIRHEIFFGVWAQCRNPLQNFAYESYGNQPIPWLPRVYRSLQLRIVNFFNRVVRPHATPVPLPDLGAIFTLLLERSFLLLPGIPERYLMPNPPPTPQPYPPPAAHAFPPSAPYVPPTAPPEPRRAPRTAPPEPPRPPPGVAFATNVSAPTPSTLTPTTSRNLKRRENPFGSSRSTASARRKDMARAPYASVFFYEATVMTTAGRSARARPVRVNPSTATP